MESRSGGGTEEFIKTNIKNERRESKDKDRSRARSRELYKKKKRKKKNLFMIHHIDSPRQLEWWRQGNIGVCFIWYSVLTCCAVACWLVVLWFLSCLGYVWISLHTTTTLPTSTTTIPNPPSPTIHLYVSACCLWLNVTGKHSEERRKCESAKQQILTCRIHELFLP